MFFVGTFPVLSRIVFLLVCLFFGTQAHAVGSATDNAIRGVFGDWAFRCESAAPSATEQCVLVQSVAAENKPDVQLAVIVLRGPSGGYILRVVVPLGIILPSGLGLKIDKVDIGRTGFMRCLANGCMAEVVMDDTLLNRFKTGDTALFVIFPTPDEGIGIPILLPGFSSGLSKLQ
jgi:invasion protein IalB